MFTIDTESGFRNAVVINAVWGLGEYIVKGVVNPDEYIVFKPTLVQGYKSLISQTLGSKEQKLIYAQGGTKSTQGVPVPVEEQQKFTLTRDESLQLAKWGMIIEEHYQKPMDIEWAKDGRSNKLYIVQARPETVQAVKSQQVLET